LIDNPIHNKILIIQFAKLKQDEFFLKRSSFAQLVTDKFRLL